jgi:hypothetical protein
MNLSVVDTSTHYPNHLAYRPGSPLWSLTVEEFVQIRHIALATSAFTQAAGHCTDSESGSIHSCGG